MFVAVIMCESWSGDGSEIIKLYTRQIRATFWHHGMPITYPWANRHKRAHEKLADLEMESLGFPQWVIITYNNYFTYEKHGHVITCYTNLTFWRHQKQCLVREKNIPSISQHFPAFQVGESLSYNSDMLVYKLVRYYNIRYHPIFVVIATYYT